MWLPIDSLVNFTYYIFSKKNLNTLVVASSEHFDIKLKNSKMNPFTAGFTELLNELSIRWKYLKFGYQKDQQGKQAILTRLFDILVQLNYQYHISISFKLGISG